MYKYSIFVIFGILLYLFLNGVDGFSIGVQDDPDLPSLSDRRHQLYRWSNEQLQNPAPNTGDVVEIYTPPALQVIRDEHPGAIDNEFELPNELQDNDIGIIEDIRELNSEEEIFRTFRTTSHLDRVRIATVRMYRPYPNQRMGNIQNRLNSALQQLNLAFAVFNPRNQQSPLNIISEDLLTLIITAMEQIVIPITRFENIPVDRLQITLNPIHILNPPIKFTCLPNGICVKDEQGEFDNLDECTANCRQTSTMVQRILGSCGVQLKFRQ
tara:strand:+ start:151 stop:957 length:807 start_codon:yes stop_codon:yes gene_type:complete